MGEILPTTATYTVNGTVYNANVTWYDGETEATTTKRGKTYLAVITLTESVADGVVFSETGSATVNGNAAESWKTVDGGVNVSIRMEAEMPSVTGSMIGNGSWTAIAILTSGLVACVAITIIVYKKRQKASNER